MVRIKVVKLIILFSVFVNSNSVLSCSCYGPDYFDLLTYDTNDCIFEVTIKSKYDPRLDSLKNETLKPSPLNQFNFDNGYYITVNEVYKGEVDLYLKQMGFSNWTSCSWTPEIGHTYIFYSNGVGGVEMCNRKVVLEYDLNEYETEKTILRTLKENPDTVSIRIGKKMLIEGRNRKGVRTGTWLIYSLTEKNDIAFELDYEKGILKEIRIGPGYDIDEYHWHSIVYSEYRSYILENKN